MVSQSVMTSAPSENVVSVSELKDYLRVDEVLEDSRIDIMIKAATRRLEALCDSKFVTQTWETYFDNFPYANKDDWWDGTKEMAISELQGPADKITLPFGPLQSVTSFSTFDDADTEYVFPTTEYSVDTKGPAGRVGLKEGAVWPVTVLRSVNGIKVIGVYGYGAAAAVPADIKLAIMQFASKMYEHRGDELPKVPSEVALLIEPYRRMKVGCR